MIKAVGEAGGKRFLLIGLSDENIRRLINGQPIRFQLPEPLDPTSNVFIIAGTTEEIMMEQIKESWAAHDVEVRWEGAGDHH